MEEYQQAARKRRKLTKDDMIYGIFNESIPEEDFSRPIHF